MQPLLEGIHHFRRTALGGSLGRSDPEFSMVTLRAFGLGPLITFGEGKPA
jgi:hypothetical protein